MAKLFILTIALIVCAISQSQAQAPHINSEELTKLFQKSPKCAVKFQIDIAPCTYQTSRDTFQVLVDTNKDLTKGANKLCCLGLASLDCFKPLILADECHDIKAELAHFFEPQEKQIKAAGCTWSSDKFNCSTEIAEITKQTQACNKIH